jgi:nucleotide-binding universal stress UspA family protein
MPFRKILVPVDFSDASENATRLAVSLARQTNAHIMLLHIGVVPHFYATELGMSGSTAPFYLQMSKEIAREQLQRLEKLEADFIPDDVSSSIQIREGFPPEEILEQTEDGGHDLLVMGTHGRTGLKRALLGSVTERVVREATIPVMVTH